MSIYDVNSRRITNNVKIAMCQFVTNFLSYTSAKCYLNWLTIGKVVAKIKMVDFLLRHSVCLPAGRRE